MTAPFTTGPFTTTSEDRVPRVPPAPCALVVFARAPEHGRVKTRLAAALGPDAALAIYRALGRRVVGAIAPLTTGGAAGGCDVVIAHTPDHGAPAIRAWLGTAWRTDPQGDGDLGARMAGAVARRLAEGAERVVVIGTDCPDVDAGVVSAAFAWLDTRDAVFGPAADGGYYLVGLHRRAVPRALEPLFAGVPWSCAETLAVTLRRAAAHGVSAALLPELHDVDTAADWAAWQSRQASGVVR